MTKHMVTCSLQRTGHNAVLKWLLYQNENVKEFHEWELRAAFAGSSFQKHGGYVQTDTGSVEYGSYVATEVINPTLRFNSQHKYHGLPNAAHFIWNFVDVPVLEILDNVCTCEDIINPTTVVIVRDWKNYIASHIKHSEDKEASPGPPVQDRVKPIVFKEYARYFIDESPYYPILFDSWFSNKEYRIKICEDLGLHFTDFGKQGVADFGRGSSFDLRKFDGQAEKMDVLNRYKLYKDDEDYEGFMQDEEAVELNNQMLEKCS
jgi:hypothetical protein